MTSIEARNVLIDAGVFPSSANVVRLTTLLSLGVTLEGSIRIIADRY